MANNVAQYRRKALHEKRRYRDGGHIADAFRISEEVKVVKRESIVVSMLYQVLFTVGNAVIFTDEYIGITEVTSLLFGDVLVV